MNEFPILKKSGFYNMLRWVERSEFRPQVSHPYSMIP